MTNPIRRRALLWSALPVLFVLNLLAWRGLGVRADPAASAPWPASLRLAQHWIPMDAEARRRLAAGQRPVRVVRGEDGAPLAGAPIWISGLPRYQFRYWSAQFEATPPPVRPADARTDADGIAWIDLRGQAGLWLRATDPDSSSGLAYGSTLIFGFSDELRRNVGEVAAVLHVYEEAMRFVVDVRTSSGRRAPEAPVFLLDASGISRLPLWPHADEGTWLSCAFPEWGDDSSVREGSPLRIAAGPSVAHSVPISSRHFRGEPARIVLGAAGTVALRSTPARLPALDAPLPVAVADADEDGFPEEVAWKILAPHERDGVVLIGGLPVGKRWRIGAPLLADERWFWTECDGPRNEGEEVAVELDLRAASQLLRGALAWADGRPAAELGLSVELRRTSGGPAQAFPLVSGPDGSFAFELPVLPDHPWEQATFTTDSPPAGLPYCVDWTLDLTSAAERAGALRPEVRAHGPFVRIVDPSGAAIRGAEVFVRPLEFQGKGRPGPWTSDHASDGWLEIRRNQTYGDPPYEVVVNHPYYLAADGRLEAGQETLTLTLHPAARVRGRVLLPAGAQAEVHVLPALAGESPAVGIADFERTSVTSPLGYFDCGPFPAGLCDLELLVGGLRFARIAGVPLESGVTVAPVEFWELDLRHCRIMTIAIVDLPAGVARESVQAQVEFADGSLEHASGLSLVLPPEAQRVRISAAGCAEAWVPATEVHARVTLRRTGS